MHIGLEKQCHEKPYPYLTNKEKPAIYEVVSAGPGTKDVTMAVKPGDKVVVGKFAGSELKLDGEEYKFVKQDDILAVVVD